MMFPPLVTADCNRQPTLANWRATVCAWFGLAFVHFVIYVCHIPSGETVRPQPLAQDVAVCGRAGNIRGTAMTNKDEKPALPKLILLYGSSGKKSWALSRDAVTVGRARGCDIVLEAPDVSSLHCLVWRTSSGLSVRDCGSRAGTHLNGDRILEATLHDRDILQIGPFSFEVNVPAVKPIGTSVLEARCQHLERSRRNLVRLALAYRHRLGDWQQLSDSGSVLFDVHRKASGLRRRFRDFEQRVRHLENAERDLTRDRESLDCELRERLGRLKRAEQELTQRKAEVESAEVESAGQLSPSSLVNSGEAQ
jgi:pSer/pThr/pTyr-binding forkhead associated (FHA) protein